MLGIVYNFYIMSFVAEALEYKNQSKFATVFKEIMQILPTQYRSYYKMEQEKNEK